MCVWYVLHFNRMYSSVSRVSDCKAEGCRLEPCLGHMLYGRKKKVTSVSSGVEILSVFKKDMLEPTTGEHSLGNCLSLAEVLSKQSSTYKA